MSSPAMSRILLRRKAPTSFARRAAGALVLTGVVLGVAACGSSSSSPSSTTAGSVSSTTAGATSTTIGSSTTSSQPASGKASLSEIGAKLAAGQAATYVATYKVTSTENGTAGDGSFKIAHDGSSTLIAFTEAKGSFEEIGVGSKSTLCTEETGHWMCYGGSLGATISKSLSSLTSDFSAKSVLAKLKAEEAGAYDTSTSTRSFAGQSVSCVTYKSKANNGEYTVCVTSQGIMAEAIGQDASGRFTLALSNFSTSVPGSDFTPPAKTSSLG